MRILATAITSGLTAFPWAIVRSQSQPPLPLTPQVVSAKRSEERLRPDPQAAPDRIDPGAKKSRVPVLEFHDFVLRRSPATMWLDCSVPEFREILAVIDHDHLRPISLDQLYAHLAHGAPVPPRSIVLTFDDNYQGFYDFAYPILKARRYPFAMFVHTDYVGSQVGQPKMTWNTLKALVADGLATIGSHTMSHPDLSRLNQAHQWRELSESKRILETHLGIRVDYFAYPHGRNSRLTQSLVKAAGYRMAFTGINHPAEASPSLWVVNRYAQTVYRRAFHDCGFGAN